MTTPEKKAYHRFYWFDPHEGPRRHNNTTARIRRVSKRSARTTVERFERVNSELEVEDSFWDGADECQGDCCVCSFEFSLDDYAHSVGSLATFGDVFRSRAASSLPGRRLDPTSEPAALAF